ncbi:MAG: Response regulator MprA [Alphaproteobacteria bacterium MarineAlpha12_Bin1]|nr:MAG: Response regulator MprA [Alphaproteobacteria bacterium MarineAlpha12_Bin1]
MEPDNSSFVVIKIYGQGLMNKGKKILLVIKDEIFKSCLSEQLIVNDEFFPCEANNVEEAFQANKTEYFDAIILDPSHCDGFVFCRTMRDQGIKAPIIIISNEIDNDGKVLSHKSLVNDCIVKPFRLRDLLTSLRTQLREFEQSEDAVFSIGQFKFKPIQKILVNEEQRKVHLTEKEIAILKYLYQAGNKVVSREQLLVEVWGYNTEVTTHTLETHVYRLRQKIENTPSAATLLVTEPGGYRLIC